MWTKISEKKSLGATWRTYPTILYALERSLVRVQGSLTLHCTTNMWYPGTCYLSGRCNESRIPYCHSSILQLWKFRVVHWSVTNKNPLGLTINQALVSLGLAIVADVISCKKLRLGLALKGKKETTKRRFWDLISWHFLWFWGILGFTTKCIIGLVCSVGICNQFSVEVGAGQNRWSTETSVQMGNSFMFERGVMEFHMWNGTYRFYLVTAFFSELHRP